jgi:hypothetical protein
MFTEVKQSFLAKQNDPGFYFSLMRRMKVASRKIHLSLTFS